MKEQLFWNPKVDNREWWGIIGLGVNFTLGLYSNWGLGFIREI